MAEVHSPEESGKVELSAADRVRLTPSLVEVYAGRLRPIGKALGVGAERARQLIELVGLTGRARELRDQQVTQRREERQPEPPPSRPCKTCGVDFVSADRRRLNCSEACSLESKQERARQKAKAWYQAHRDKVLDRLATQRGGGRKVAQEAPETAGRS